MGNFTFSSTPYSGFNPYSGAGGTTQSLKGVYDKILNDVQSGRPGSIDYLLHVLSGLTSSAGAEQGFHQYSTMAPYLADAAQRERYTFSQTAPYMLDPYVQARQQWEIQYPWMREMYKAKTLDLGSPYRSLSPW